ncbi:Hypothetical protein NTJ_05475 [Nesidiocoris tenuis]|uniref:Uncharacterized protein n=1 Tax=Nesidiocoris tenuis TaxID=355587 RepID=A0ABN7AK86_9HEMI|nr:Hypothetical protein NTJ_05475 [Nesidiocoris tenuis]
MGSKTNGTTSSSARASRYSRSSTVSVAQLFTDSCSSLIQRIASRVRGPSANPGADRGAGADETPRCLKSTAREEGDEAVRSARSVRSKGRAERSLGRSSGAMSRFESTPSKTRTRSMRNINNENYNSHNTNNNNNNDDDASSRWMTDSAYKLTRRLMAPVTSTTTTTTREEEQRRPYRRKEVESQRRKSSASAVRSKRDEHSATNALAKSATSVVLAEKAYPYVTSVPGPPVPNPREKTPFRRRKSGEPEGASRPVLVDIAADVADPDLSERAARRKEIQSLVLKYSTWDEQKPTNSVSALSKFQQKYSSYLSDHSRTPTVSQP